MTSEAPGAAGEAKRERMTYYMGKMRPQSEVDRIQAEETGAPLPRGPKPVPATPAPPGEGNSARRTDAPETPPLLVEPAQRPEPEAEILRALQLIAPPGGIVEVRAIGDGIGSGYYDSDHLERAFRDAAVMDGTPNYGGIYVVLNEIDPALLSRRSNRFLKRLGKKDAATSDADIIRRRWLPIDIDVIRPSGISSTNTEHGAAIDAAGRIAAYLSEVCRFPAAIVADSGNGAHLLYRIDLPNDEQSANLIKRCLQALGALFDKTATENQPGYNVDQTTFNPSRIWKLYGTMARKGDNTMDRPHRRSRILEVPEKIEVVPLDVLQTLASQAPEEERPKRENRGRYTGPGIDLDEWLNQYGASLPAYRPKSRPEYTTFYEFEVCPFDPSHRDGSAWVGQLTSGALDAGCHHDGCHGKKWQDLRELVEPKRAKSTPTRHRPTPAPGVEEVIPVSDRPTEGPTICTTGAAIHEMTEVALVVVNRWNSPTPELFARSACLVRAALDEKQGLYIQEVDENGLTGILDRLIVWYRRLKDGDERPVHPPREVVRDILALPAAAWRVPHLAGVTGTPIFHLDGTIHATPGYDEETSLYYYPAAGFSLAPVPEVPTREDVTNALQVIGEVFEDFPFCGPADRANAIGALFTAVLRPGIDGPVPLYLTDKPQAGSGAGLLQRVIGWIAEGQEPALKTMPTGQDMRKEIFASLRNGTRIQIFDNLEDRLSSPELAAALTAAEMTGRILGRTEERTYTVRTFWMANGNNVTVGGDLARRTFKSRVDPQDPLPWQRTGFKHSDLIGWVQETRGAILAAVFTVARAWIQAGRPAPVQVPYAGSFEAWRDMIGGILESAGVPEFMANANEVYLQADEDRQQWENFLQALWNLYGCNPFTTGSVASRMTYSEGAILLDMMPDALIEAYHTKNKTFSQALGQAFKRVDGRHFPGGWCIRQGKIARGFRQWVITYSGPHGVECGWNADSPDTLSESKNDLVSGESGDQGGMGGMSPYTYAQAKKLIYNASPIPFIKGSKNECAMAVAGIPPIPPRQEDEDDIQPDTESDPFPAVSAFHPHSTPLIIPIPAGCLKHPIDRYERRKYGSSIMCMVPGCRRPAAYGCAAGSPLCEEHYQAEVERVRREGGLQP